MLYPESPEDERAKFPGLKWEYTREQVAQMSSFEAKNAGTLAEQNMKTMQIDSGLDSRKLRIASSGGTSGFLYGSSGY
jgi:hypothetical protein